LVVEDDPMLAQILVRFVERVEGFEVLASAYTCSEAFHLAQTLLPDLLLLDVYMDGSGIDVLKEIRNKELPCDVIMVTAAQDAATVTAGMRYGAVDYIVKPFEFERLKYALQNYLTFHNCLQEGKLNGQAAIDGLKPRTNPGFKEELPKNIDSLTLANIRKALTPGKSITAAAIAASSGISYGTVIRYLHYLVKEGMVTKNLRYPPRGRPVVEYIIKAKRG
jgi:response regulator of citrate/malate metabolism